MLVAILAPIYPNFGINKKSKIRFIKKASVIPTVPRCCFLIGTREKVFSVMRNRNGTDAPMIFNAPAEVRNFVPNINCRIFPERHINNILIGKLII